MRSHSDTHQHHDHYHAAGPSLNRTAFSATLHCLSGCATGEVLGMVIGTAGGLTAATTIALAVVLAFIFGYAFTMVPLIRGGLALGVALRLALAADTLDPGDGGGGQLDYAGDPRGDDGVGLGPALLGQPGGRPCDRWRRRVPGEPLADRPRPRPRPSSTRITDAGG